MIYANGTVEFEEPRATISPKTTLEDFLASPLFPISTALSNNNSCWATFTFEPVVIRGETFGGSVYFSSGSISWMGLYSLRPEFSQLSPESVRAQEEFYVAFLKSALESASGVAGCVEDIKTGGYSITIRYAL
jgi:hypothetical protein